MTFNSKSFISFDGKTITYTFCSNNYLRMSHIPMRRGSDTRVTSTMKLLKKVHGELHKRYPAKMIKGVLKHE